MPTLLERLDELARDLWWTGRPEATSLWHDLDPRLWHELNHNPVTLLKESTLDRAPPGWPSRAFSLLAAWDAWQADGPKWDTPKVAYFCMEFGLHESLPIYSGGLGILAGDHLRSASDMGVDLVAVGIFWAQGYFKQVVHDGQQVAAYATNDPERLPVAPVMAADGTRLEVRVPHGHSSHALRAWRVQVGRTMLYLLDANFDANPPDIRRLTHRLYDAENVARIDQEVLLGIGGVRLLEALGVEPDVFHMNEGHSAFLVLELWARGIRAGMDAEAAWQAARDRCVFTTHTPVPAGHDRFSWDALNPVLGGYRASLGLSPGSFMDRGRVHPGDIHEPLCMTVLALRGSRAANGVSALHGEVSRRMWREVPHPIGHITNGVHPWAWLAYEMEELFNAQLPGWQAHIEDVDFWQRAHDIPTGAMLATRDALRKRLVSEVRRRRGVDVLDENALTIGFARRFAPYKRGALLFTDPNRLKRILDRSVQIIYAGKAHPADPWGQQIAAEVIKWSRDPRFRNRVVFLPDYDIALGRLLTQGCDVWLNTPRRPREASGTSGEKAALNGNQNLSILDGWWPEAHDGNNGWAIGEDADWDGIGEQDERDAELLYRLLEEEVHPTFTHQEQWAKRMAHTLATCLPQFNTHRMVREYVETMYRKP